MTDSLPASRRFKSAFTPLRFEGPLPPSITERIVVSAYKSIDLRPKRVLLTLDIKRFSDSPEKRLRKVLDRPEARRGKSDPRAQKLPPFHLALYEWQKNQSQNVYDRLIKPAEYEEKGHMYLNPEKFRALIEKERNETSAFLSPRIDPGTEAEGIAIFAFAYALLQPKDAYQILEPLLSIGRQFQEFYGVTETGISDPSVSSSDGNIDQKTDNSKNGPS
jgi:hypothetical protein